MKLTTWTIYHGQKLKNISNQVVVDEEFPFLLLRPDLNQPNEFLGMAIVSEFVGSLISDLLNRELDSDQLIEIFKDKMGLVNTEDLKEYWSKDQNLSASPIYDTNIKTLMETYNILIKADPITFESDEYDTQEKIDKTKDVFLEFDFENMPMHQLINAINSGMPEFYHRLNELRNNELDDQTRQEKIVEMAGLQTNLIFFFEQALKKMDKVIGEQQKEIEELKAELTKNKGKDSTPDE